MRRDRFGFRFFSGPERWEERRVGRGGGGGGWGMGGEGRRGAREGKREKRIRAIPSLVHEPFIT